VSDTTFLTAISAFITHTFLTACCPAGTVATIPPMVLSPTMWMDSDATSFRVRSKDYKTSQRKCASAPALFKFIGIDLFETPEAQKNMGGHPKNRVNQALQRGDSDWVFMVNIMVPGTPYLNFVTYFVGDKVGFRDLCL
jgi:hypothetical protein